MQMDFASFGKFISKFAPLLGAIISTANPLAGIFVNLIAKLFDGDKDNLQDLINKIITDNNSADKLKQLELEHRDSIYKTKIQDRISAREREKSIVESTKKRDYLLDFISFAVILGFFTTCAIFLFVDLEKKDQSLIYMILGQLTGGFIMVLSYYFGDSHKK